MALDTSVLYEMGRTSFSELDETEMAVFRSENPLALYVLLESAAEDPPNREVVAAIWGIALANLQRACAVELYRSIADRALTCLRETAQ